MWSKIKGYMRVAKARTREELEKALSDADLIFCRPDGGPLEARAMRRHLYRAMDDAGIVRVKSNYRFHIFRHSAATMLFEQRRDINQVQSMLRHSDVGMTNRYVHVEQPTIEGAEMLMEVVMGANCADFVTQNDEIVH